jgi:OmcA/MtrC family decaheme c-type cytochrome
VNPFGEVTTYRVTTPPATLDFLVGSATKVDPYTFLSSPKNCYSCHDDVWFHGGGRRGVETCLLCHTLSGAEDRPRYVAGNAPATPGVTIDFRTMLHKIHQGAALDKAADYVVVGFGSSPYPNNFSANSYADVEFPPMPDGTKQCGTCHGDGNTAWQLPSSRNHPTEQGRPVLAWRAVCNACHDSDAATAHIESQTSPSGGEACEICHGVDGQLPVQIVHKSR